MFSKLSKTAKIMVFKSESIDTHDWPLVTIVIVNYNSSKFFNIVKSSIKGFLTLDYKPYEVIIVDNGSNDDSILRIKNLLKDMLRDGVIKAQRVILIELSKNFGYAGAVYIAYKFRSPSSKYFVVANNDLIPLPFSLRLLINALNKCERICGGQGIILSLDGRYIDSAGTFVADDGTVFIVGRGLSTALLHRARLRPYPVTSIEGMYAVYKVDALERAGGPYLPQLIHWAEDLELSIRLWNTGCILVCMPIIVGYHARSLTVNVEELVSSRKILDYSSWRNITIATMILYKTSPLSIIKRFILTLVKAFILRSEAKYILKGFLDSFRIGIKLKTRLRSMLSLPSTTGLQFKLKTKYIRLLPRMLQWYLRYGVRAYNNFYFYLVKSMFLELAKARSLKSMIEGLNKLLQKP